MFITKGELCERPKVFREGAEHRTRGRVRSPFLLHSFGFIRQDA
jgi:hypothetical protein